MIGSRVLSLVRGDGPTPASDRGGQIAQACGAELIVVRAAARPDHERVLPTPPAGVGEDCAEFAAIEQRPLLLTQAMIADTGSLVVDLDVAVIVVDGQLAPVAVELAESWRVPVLVARAARGERVVIATDLAAPDHPVLSAGVRFATRLAVPATAVANVQPVGPDGDGAALRGRIVAFMHQRGVSRTVIAREASTPHAIFDVARSEHADVIVVGTRRQRWLRGHAGTSVPERIAREASCSVLVAPSGVASA